MERLSEDGKWQQSKRRKTTKTAADIVNQWTSSNPEASWIDEVQKMDKVSDAPSFHSHNLNYYHNH
jgi:hypothetical protein